MKYFFQGIVVITLLATISHLLFSSLGFNPSDDGFILSGAKRILLGEVPHRDFIIIRPMLPYILHTPEVYFGGENGYYISRFVAWFQFAIIAWFSVLIAEKVLKQPFSFLKKTIFATLAFMYDAHNFPLMVWYSIDAVMFAVIGAYLILFRNEKTKIAGYIVLGLAPLCRQNFLLLAPLLLFVQNDWRKIRYWIASFLPLFVMVAYLLVMGAIKDAVVQMTAHTELLTVGFIKYYRTKAFIRGIVVGIIGVYFYLARVKVSWIKNKSWLQELIGRSILFVSLFIAAKSMVYPDNYIDIGSYIVFGLVGGIILFLIFEMPTYKVFIKLGIIMLAISWSVSVSLGYNTPALATAGLVVFLLAFLTNEIKSIFLSRIQFVLICFLITPVFFIFKDVREHQIYREQAVQNLVYPLDGVFPGGNHLKTNKRVYLFLVDLKKATTLTQGRPYIILPDVPGYWAFASQKNALPIDWPSPSELNTKPLMDRAFNEFVSKRGAYVVILQKYVAANLQDGYFPINRTETPLITYVTTKMKKVGETELFELYE